MDVWHQQTNKLKRRMSPIPPPLPVHKMTKMHEKEKKKRKRVLGQKRSILLFVKEAAVVTTDLWVDALAVAGLLVVVLMRMLVVIRVNPQSSSFLSPELSRGPIVI